MLINKFGKFVSRKYFDEVDGEGNDLGGAPSPDTDFGGEGGESTPEYLFGDVTADEAADRFGFLRELPDQLRGLESRVSEPVGSVMEQLKSLSEKVGSQPVFEPKLEKFAAAMKEYDGNSPHIQAAIEGLMEDLKGSMTSTPLNEEVLGPLIQPMIEQAEQKVTNKMLPLMLDMLPFDANAIVNRDPANPDNVLEAETDLQKSFHKWYGQLDAPTRNALSTYGVPYAQALQKFGKWNAEQIRKKGGAAGAASARLKGAAQKPGGATREPNNSGELRTEADGFNAYFKRNAE